MALSQDLRGLLAQALREHWHKICVTHDLRVCYVQRSNRIEAQLDAIEFGNHSFEMSN